MGMIADEHRWPIGPLVWDVRDSKGFSGCPSLEWLSDSRAERLTRIKMMPLSVGKIRQYREGVLHRSLFAVQGRGRRRQ
jgi:hypothetical protein